MPRGISKTSAAVPVVRSIVANGDMVDQSIFVVPPGDIYEVQSFSESHATAGSDGGAVTLALMKCTGTQAPSAGTALLGVAGASTVNLKGTANTPQNFSQDLGTVHADRSKLRLVAGDRLALDFTGTMTALAGVTCTVVLKRLVR